MLYIWNIVVNSISINKTLKEKKLTPKNFFKQRTSLNYFSGVFFLFSVRHKCIKGEVGVLEDRSKGIWNLNKVREGKLHSVNVCNFREGQLRCPIDINNFLNTLLFVLWQEMTITLKSIFFFLKNHIIHPLLHIIHHIVTENAHVLGLDLDGQS